MSVVIPNWWLNCSVHPGRMFKIMGTWQMFIPKYLWNLLACPLPMSLIRGQRIHSVESIRLVEEDGQWKCCKRPMGTAKHMSSWFMSFEYTEVQRERFFSWKTRRELADFGIERCARTFRIFKQYVNYIFLCQTCILIHSWWELCWGAQILRAQLILVDSARIQM